MKYRAFQAFAKARRGVIEQTAPQKCELCGEIEELRPYGPNGENVCFPCGMKDKAAVSRGFRRLIEGEGNA
jgi:hypothetical protein